MGRLLDKNNAEDRRQWWSFVLKNYCMYERHGAGRDDDSRRKIQKHNWNVDESLNFVRNDLDELAESIGGTCVVDVTKGGKRRLIIRKAKAGRNMSVTTQQVEKTVEKMREIVHARYRQPSNLLSDEKKHSRKKKRGNRKWR
jgi:hypothetical protein